MKQLIKMFNSYPGVKLNEHDFVFSRPIYIAHLKKDVVNVKSKLNSRGYIDKDFFYKRYDLNVLSADKQHEIDLERESTTHQLIHKLNQITWFPYQEGGPLDVQDKYVQFTTADIINSNISISDPNGTDIFIEAHPDSFYFRGKLKVRVKVKMFNVSITQIDFVSNVIAK